MNPEELRKRIQDIKNSLSSNNKAAEKKENLNEANGKAKTAKSSWEAMQEAKRNMITAREKIYGIMAKVIEKLRGVGIFLKVLRIDMNDMFFQVDFEDESLKDYLIRDGDKKRFRLCFSREVVESKPLPWEDPLSQGPTEAEIINRLFDALKGEYQKWYERLVMTEGLMIGNPINVLLEASKLLLKKKNIQIIPKELTQDQIDPSHVAWDARGARLQMPPDYTLTAEMYAPMHGRAEVKMFLRQKDFELKPSRIDELAGISANISGFNRVKLRLAFHLFKAFKRVTTNEIDTRGKDIGESLDRVINISITY